MVHLVLLVLLVPRNTQKKMNRKEKRVYRQLYKDNKLQSGEGWMLNDARNRCVREKGPVYWKTSSLRENEPKENEENENYSTLLSRES